MPISVKFCKEREKVAVCQQVSRRIDPYGPAMDPYPVRHNLLYLFIKVPNVILRPVLLNENF